MKHLNVSWSRINEWLTCKWRYHHRYEEYYTSIQIAEPLYYGGMFHSLLEYIYSTYERDSNPTNRMSRTAIRNKLKREGAEDEDLEVMMKYAMTYVEHMERNKVREPDDIVLTEFPFKVDLSQDLALKYLNAYLPMEVSIIGIMDMVCVRRKRREVWDHKLQGNHPPNNALDHPPLSYPQMGIYTWATQYLGAFCGASVLNVYGKRRASNNVQRYPIVISKKEANQWERWLYEIVADMLANPSRVKSLGRQECNYCFMRYPCSKHQSKGDAGYQKALAQTMEKKPYQRSGVPVWRPRFPQSAIDALQEAK